MRSFTDTRPSKYAWVVLALFGLATEPGRAQCGFDWTSGFEQRGLSGGVAALQVCDLGDGPHLYAGGGFTRQSGQFVNHIAKWTGSTWTPLGLGMNADVRTLAAANLGSGLSLYAGGGFNQLEGQPSMNVARWSGTSWNQMTSIGSQGGAVGIKVWPGSPAAIYGVNGNMLSVTTGGPWTEVASIVGNNYYLTALEIFDDGTGPHVYVAGSFTTLAGTTLNHIAKWTGTAWQPLGSGMNDWVSSLAVYDDGTGPALYAGGAFTTAGGVLVHRVAKWNGSAWSGVGGGVPGGMVYTLSAQNWGLGSRLLVSGYFLGVGVPLVQAINVASWDGASWAPLGGGFGPQTGVSEWANSFAVLDEGSGPALIAGGGFRSAGGQAVNYIARWDGAAWHPMPDGNGFNYGDDREVTSTVVWDDGNGPALYCAGNFASVGDVIANNIVRFDGTTWSPLGSGTNGGIRAIAVYDDGNGPALYAGGGFSQAGGVPASNIAKWNGTQWSALGIGLTGGTCFSLEPITSGPYAGTLAAGGTFNTAGGYSAWHVAFWNGSSWLSTWPATTTVSNQQEIRAIASFDNGTGWAIYTGGPGGPGGASACWKYDGSTWTAVGTNAWQIYDFQVFDSGAGPQLYGAGSTTISNPTYCFAQLTGSSWTAVPGSPPTTAVRTLRVHSDESGNALYLGGETSVPGQGPAYLQRWNGAQFTPLGAGVGGLQWSYANWATQRVDTLTSFDSGAGPALYAGGTFTQAGAFESALIARWAAQRPTLSLTQSAPGAGVVITNGGLLPGRVYHNVFSLELCGVPGSGPYLGLCASDPAPLIAQFTLPLGAVPFHFLQSAATQAFGPYAVPAGLVFDGVTFDYTSGVLGCASTVQRFTVQ